MYFKLMLAVVYHNLVITQVDTGHWTLDNAPNNVHSCKNLDACSVAVTLISSLDRQIMCFPHVVIFVASISLPITNVAFGNLNDVHSFPRPPMTSHLMMLLSLTQSHMSKCHRVLRSSVSTAKIQWIIVDGKLRVVLVVDKVVASVVQCSVTFKLDGLIYFMINAFAKCDRMSHFSHTDHNKLIPP